MKKLFFLIVTIFFSQIGKTQTWTFPSNIATYNGRVNVVNSSYGFAHYNVDPINNANNQYLISGYSNSNFSIVTGKNGNLSVPSLILGTSDIERMRIDAFGRIGIGTTSPLSQFHLASDVDHALTISRINGTYGFRIFRNAQEGSIYFQIGNTQNTWETKIKIGEGEGVNTKLILNPTGGNVGIGLLNPQNALDVNGTVHAKEVKVDLNGWSDFVFKSNYKLLSLQELEQYIKQNEHLPEIPTELEVKQNGISLGDIQNKLLQKIEELTIYTIEQQKQIDELKKQIDELKK